jgi:hypothetical protein
MNQPMEFQRVLVLSTAHLPQWIAEGLDGMSGGQVSEEVADKLAGVSFDRLEYGYLVYVSYSGSDGRRRDDDGLDAQHPEEMRPAMKLARAHDCDYIRYDSDGPKIAGLQVWDW